ncbi:MAG TPA: 6-phosphogluconolactonase [Thermomicrobiales bacterium]|nr:6-phosphogluconolactonase [Thermomicrobiales bacterium]
MNEPNQPTTLRQIETPRGQVAIVADPDALAEAAATRFVAAVAAATNERGHAFVALSGGSTPKRMGKLLASAAFRERVDWDRLDLFWGDERWVPLDSPESNAGEALRDFIGRTPLPLRQVHPFPTDLATPADAAAAYEATLRAAFGMADGAPRFDLILLGMGDDGHTASLFPHTKALAVRDRLATANFVPKLDASRLTLTVPVFDAGRDVLFLVSGPGKADTLRQVLEGPDDPERFPSQLIRPHPGSLLWLADRAAAADLRR